jgi:hypothetical protein
MGNSELVSLTESEFISPEITKNSVIWRLHRQMSTGGPSDSQLAFIASRFGEITKSLADIGFRITGAILARERLCIESGYSSFDFIVDLALAKASDGWNLGALNTCRLREFGGL